MGFLVSESLLRPGWKVILQLFLYLRFVENVDGPGTDGGFPEFGEGAEAAQKDLRLRIEVPGPFDEGDAVHSRHLVVDQDVFDMIFLEKCQGGVGPVECPDDFDVEDSG